MNAPKPTEKSGKLSAPGNGSTPAIFISLAVTVWTAVDCARLTEREKAAMVVGCLLMFAGYWINQFVWWALDKWVFAKASNVSDQRPGDRDATNNKSSGIAGFAASDG